MAYTLNSRRKWITLDEKKLTKSEEQEIQLYLSAGWILKKKDKAKAERAKKIARTDTNESIRAELKNYPDILAQYDKILATEGNTFFTARKFYYDWKKDASKKKTTKKAQEESAQ